MSVLKQNFDKGLLVLADMLMNPAFREEEIDLVKTKHRSDISRRNDDVISISDREFYKLIYGPQSVYARHTEHATIDHINRDDLVAFHKRFFGPDNLMLAICGDFDKKVMIKKIEHAFDGWQKVNFQFLGAPNVQHKFRKTVNLVRKDDINQSRIYLGHIGGLMRDPDYFALLVMNRILGGSFTGRLFKNIRSRQGLAYSAFGMYWANFDYPGDFCIGCQTKSETTVMAIRAMTHEIKKITENAVTEEELALAKEGFLNSFASNFESNFEIVKRLMTLQYFGYPSDFLQITKSNVEKVTKADILRAAREHIKPDKVQILVVGNPDQFDEPLSTLGQVNEIDITIPTP
jgi:zinc protease